MDVASRYCRRFVKLDIIRGYAKPVIGVSWRGMFARRLDLD